MNKLNLYFRLTSFLIVLIIGIFIPLQNYFSQNKEANFQWSMFNSSMQICQLLELGSLDDHNKYRPKEKETFYQNQPKLDRQRFFSFRNDRFLAASPCQPDEKTIKIKYRCTTQNTNAWSYFERERACN